MTIHADFDLEKAVVMARSALEAMKPAPVKTVSGWLEENYNENGARIRLLPYQRAIADHFDCKIPEVAWLKSARVGATAVLAAGLSYLVANDAGSIGICVPTRDDAKDMAAGLIKTALTKEGCPAAAVKLEGPGVRDNDLSKKWNGGRGKLDYLIAAAPRTARRKNIRVLLMDECGAYADSVTPSKSEGDFIALCKRRSQNESRPFAYLNSTPKDGITDGITEAFNRGDQRYFFLTCPDCGEKQHLKFERLHTADGIAVTQVPRGTKPASIPFGSVTYCCEGCGSFWPETIKQELLEDGEWIATAPENLGSGTASYHIWTGYSPFPNATWSHIVREYLEARLSPEGLQQFTNTVLGRPWESTALENLEHQKVKKRTVDWSTDLIPRSVLALALGVDVQQDRVEASLIGLEPPASYDLEGRGRICLLDRIVIKGDTDADPADPGDTVWRRLDAVIQRRYRHERGGTIGLSIACIDSGYRSLKVYQFTAPRAGVYAVKGVAGKKPAWELSKSKKAIVHNIGVDDVKESIHQRLHAPMGEDGAFVISQALLDSQGDDVVEQLLAERLIIKPGSKRQKVWEKVSSMARSEVFDGCVYALAGLSSQHLDWSRIADDLTEDHAPEQKRKPTLAELGRMMNTGA